MIYSNVDFNVVYIDPSIEAPGDGTTPAGALKALPASAADLLSDSPDPGGIRRGHPERREHQHHKFAASRDAESLRPDV